MDQLFQLRQVIDLRDTDKVQYFAKTVEFNNCFIIRSLICFAQLLMGTTHFLGEGKHNSGFDDMRQLVLSNFLLILSDII